MWRKESAKKKKKKKRLERDDYSLRKGERDTEDFCLYRETWRNKLHARPVLPKINGKQWA